MPLTAYDVPTAPPTPKPTSSPTAKPSASADSSFQSLQSQLGVQSGGGTYTAQQYGPNFSSYNISEADAGLMIVWDSGGNIVKVPTSDNLSPLRGMQTRDVVQGATSYTMIDALRYYYALDQNTLPVIQAALVNSGFIKEKKWNGLGNRFDETSFKAWGRALTMAARSGKSIWEVLGAKNQHDFWSNAQGNVNDALKRLAGNLGGGGPKRAPFQARLTNPDDLKAVATRAAQETLGYVPDSAFLDQFVKLYQGMESGAQRTAYNGGNYTAPADPGVAAEKQLRAKYKTQASGHDVAKQFEAFLQIIGGGSQ